MQTSTTSDATLTVVRPAVTLIAQASPVAPISAAHCKPDVRLFSVHVVQHGLAFHHARTGELVFLVTGSFLTTRKTLVDRQRVAIATFKEHDVTSCKRATYVHASRKPRDRNAPPLLQIDANYWNGGSTVVHVTFTNAATREHCEIGFHGDWQRRDAHLWLKRAHSGVREPVATIHSRHGESFHVDVAPNMDAALVAIICAVLQRAQRKFHYVEHTNAMAW